MTLSNSTVSQKLQVRLAFTSWGLMELLYAIEGFECSKGSIKEKKLFHSIFYNFGLGAHLES